MANMERPNVEMADKERQKLWQEYSEMMFMLPGYFRRANEKMEQMRAEDIPKPEEYEKMRRDVQEAYDRFKEVSRQFVDYKEDIIQESFIKMMQADAQWHDRNRAPGTPGKRRTDYEPGEVRREPLELYDEGAVKLLAEVVEIEADAEAREKAGTLDNNAREELRDTLATIYDKLDQLDQAAEKGVADASRERKALIGVLKQLNEGLKKTPAAVAASSPLAAVRATHRQVKAQYASVQHTLTEDQRRAMRERIAQLTALVRQAEDEAWGKAFQPPLPPEPPLPAPGPRAEPEELQAAIRLAVARASEAAPVVATAVMAPSEVRSRGILGALGDAFKLK